MKWLLDNVKEVKDAEAKGRLCFGTIDSWLVYKLTGGKRHITEATNASRTQCMDINSLTWSQDMLDAFNIKQESLPEIVKESASDFGTVSESILSGVPITGIIGDQQSA